MYKASRNANSWSFVLYFVSSDVLEFSFFVEMCRRSWYMVKLEAQVFSLFAWSITTNIDTLLLKDSASKWCNKLRDKSGELKKMYQWVIGVVREERFDVHDFSNSCKFGDCGNWWWKWLLDSHKSFMFYEQLFVRTNHQLETLVWRSPLCVKRKIISYNM